MDTHLLAKWLVLSEESYHVLPRLRVWEGVKPESRDRPALQARGFASSSSCAVTGSPVASAPAEMKQGVLAVFFFFLAFKERQANLSATNPSYNGNDVVSWNFSFLLKLNEARVFVVRSIFVAYYLAITYTLWCAH